MSLSIPLHSIVMFCLVWFIPSQNPQRDGSRLLPDGVLGCPQDRVRKESSELPCCFVCYLALCKAPILPCCMYHLFNSVGLQWAG